MQSPPGGIESEETVMEAGLSPGADCGDEKPPGGNGRQLHPRFAMKPRSYFLIALLLLPVTALRQAVAEAKSSFPASFESKQAAVEFVHGLFASGDVEELRVDGQTVLVVFIYGSGLPEIAIAGYTFVKGHWQLKSKILPPSVEFHKAVVVGKEIVLVGEDSKETWPFLKLEPGKS
jgi:hypothetical protein